MLCSSILSGGQRPHDEDEDEDECLLAHPRAPGIHTSLGTNCQHFCTRPLQNKAHVPVFNCQLLPLRYFDELFYRYFHLQGPKFQDLDVINLLRFPWPILPPLRTPPLTLTPGEMGYGKARRTLRARCLLHANSPHAHVSQMPPCRTVHLESKMLCN